MGRVAAARGTAYFGKQLLYLPFGPRLFPGIWHCIKGFPIPLHRSTPACRFGVICIGLRCHDLALLNTSSKCLRAAAAILTVCVQYRLINVMEDSVLNGHRRALKLVRRPCYDIKNLKLKIRPGGEHKYNSPWNIAADFSVDMSFSVEDIAGMLEAYEHDHQTGMEIKKTAGNIYEYTSGYPYLVSGICKLMDEQVGKLKGFDAGSAWSAAGVREAVRIFLKESNTLFDDMINKLTDYEELCLIIKGILFSGQTFAFNPYNYAINVGRMLGFIKESNEVAVVANRIFEMHLYNYFLSEEMTKSVTYKSALQEKNQFVAGKDLDMDKVLQKFGEHYSEIYSDNDVKFLEENGRRLFLLYLKPIINGSGNYYVEARTRDMNRTDVVIDYCGKQYIVEMKIHRGEAYERKGIEQLAGYLEEYHLSKGYMLVFNFNKHKKAEMKTVKCNGKEIMEVVV